MNIEHKVNIKLFTDYEWLDEDMISNCFPK